MGRALIVSAGASSNEYISARLAELGYPRPLIVPSGAEARRRYWNPILSSSWSTRRCRTSSATSCARTPWRKRTRAYCSWQRPLPPSSCLGTMSDAGVLLLSKPFSNTLFLQAIHIAAASNHRLLRLRQENAKMQEKIAQVRLVSRAKCCLIEREGMTETDAHRLIEKRAMDTRRDRAEIAQEILDSYED